jgi:hypothetical protein
MEGKKKIGPGRLAAFKFLKSGWKAACLILLFLLSYQLSLPPGLAQEFDPQTVALNLWKKLSSVTSL